jgi:cytochrome c-type biogenesis protein CcmH
MRRAALSLGIFATVLAAIATAADLNVAQQARYHALTDSLRCLICQNRSIAQSDAPLARDLRHIVAAQIAHGRSDAQIKQYLVARYGQWVLYDPPFELATALLWLSPFALLLVGLAIVVAIMRKRRRLEQRPALDRARLARVLGEHGLPDGRDP